MLLSNYNINFYIKDVVHNFQNEKNDRLF